MKKDSLTVRPKDGETSDHMIKRFCKSEDYRELIAELRRRAAYVKPSQRRRIKSMLARNRKMTKSKR